MRRVAMLFALCCCALGMAPKAIFAPLETTLTLSAVPVYLPAWIPPFDGAAKRLYASVEYAGRDGYLVRVDPVPGCHGADACSFLSVRGMRTPYGRIDASHPVRLSNGTRASYEPIACGASCGPETLTWDRGGNRYQITIRDASERTILRVANSMLLGN